MKILVIGDPHGRLDKIKKISKKGIDLILLTGDLGKADLARKRFFENFERKKEGLPELQKDKRFVANVHYEIHNSTLGILKYLSKYAPVYTIQGNVGIPTISDVKKEKKKWGINLPSTKKEIDSMKDVYVAKNTLRKIDDLKIGFLEYFTDVNWVKDFKPANYQKRMKSAIKQAKKAKRVLKRFGSLEILVCHQPPYGFLDKVGHPAPVKWHGKHAGSQAILDYVKKYQPKYVFCGHIHEGEGNTKIGKTEVYNLGVGGHKIIEI